MIINPGIKSLIKIYANQQVKGTQTETVSKAGTVKGADKTEFSPEGKFLVAALQTARELPEVRQEKVAALKAALQTGTYSVNDNALAEKMLKERTFDKLI